MRPFSVAIVAITVLAGTVAEATCTGDCGGNGVVTVNEIVLGVNIALGASPLAQCPSFDHSGDGRVLVNELVTAVSQALNGCPFTGQYTAQIDVGDGDVAIIHIQVAPDGSATGSLSTTAAPVSGRPALRISIPFVSITGTVDLETGAYSFSGSYAGPDGPVPIDVSGTLPETFAGAGNVDLDIGPDQFAGNIAAGTGVPVSTPTPTVTGGTTTQTPGTDECMGNGSITVEISNVQNTNAITDSPLALDIVSGEDRAENDRFVWSIVGHQCLFDPNARSRNFIISGRADQEVTPATYPFSIFGGPFGMGYSEFGGGIPGVGAIWFAESGTVTVDAVDGDSVTFHAVGSMRPAVGPLGVNAQGTFTMAASGRIEHWKFGGTPAPTPTMPAIAPDPRLAGTWSGTATDNATLTLPARLGLEIDGSTVAVTDLMGNTLTDAPMPIIMHPESGPTALAYVCDTDPCGPETGIITFDLSLLPSGRLVGVYRFDKPGTSIFLGFNLGKQ